MPRLPTFTSQKQRSQIFSKLFLKIYYFAHFRRNLGDGGEGSLSLRLSKCHANELQGVTGKFQDCASKNRTGFAIYKLSTVVWSRKPAERMYISAVYVKCSALYGCVVICVLETGVIASCHFGSVTTLVAWPEGGNVAWEAWEVLRKIWSTLIGWDKAVGSSNKRREKENRMKKGQSKRLRQQLT